MNIQNLSPKKAEIASLKKSLMFLHVGELRDLSAQLSLVDKGNKKVIIFRICHFFLTGEKLKVPKFPKESCAQRGKTYPLKANGLMLKGAYKNDLKTRIFFKRLVGSHFHFTAFGIDWLNERWMEGNPPTYLEFANMWEEEYYRRKENPVAPKEEWAYINFVRNFLTHSPEASKACVYQAWKDEREKNKAKAYQQIEKFLCALNQNRFSLSLNHFNC